jgi:hypothetical protein
MSRSSSSRHERAALRGASDAGTRPRDIRSGVCGNALAACLLASAVYVRLRPFFRCSAQSCAKSTFTVPASSCFLDVMRRQSADAQARSPCVRGARAPAGLLGSPRACSITRDASRKAQQGARRSRRRRPIGLRPQGTLVGPGRAKRGSRWNRESVPPQGPGNRGEIKSLARSRRICRGSCVGRKARGTRKLRAGRTGAQLQHRIPVLPPTSILAPLDAYKSRPSSRFFSSRYFLSARCPSASELLPLPSRPHHSPLRRLPHVGQRLDSHALPLRRQEGAGDRDAGGRRC